MPKTKATPLITLQLDTGAYPFSDLEELRTWLDHERKAFNWLSEHTNIPGIDYYWQAFTHWCDYVDIFIRQYENAEDDDTEAQTSLIDNLKKETDSIINENLITSESPIAKFVFSLREKRSDSVAAHALSALSKNRRSRNADALEGAYRALQYVQGSAEAIEAHEEWFVSLSEQIDVWLQKQIKILSQKDKELEQSENRRVKRADAQKESFDNFIVEAKKELENISNSYKAHMALRAPVTYWAKKRDSHTQAIQWLGSIAILSALATAGGAIYVFADFISPAFQARDPDGITIPVWGFGLLFIVSTLGIWITRLTTKMFVSNLHLREDANERVVMTQAYIALSNDKGFNEDERKIVLSTLFRPSSSDFVQDDGPTGFPEMLSKARNQQTQ